MFDWKNEFSVGIGSVDAQHQTLFAIGRELYAAMSAGQGRAVVGKILDRLVRYTTVHFAHEERLMHSHEYPNFAAHKAQHDALTRQVLKFQADFDGGRASVTLQLLQFLKNWIEAHIKESDFAYAPCLKQQSVK
jgi:hemerythrin